MREERERKIRKRGKDVDSLTTAMSCTSESVAIIGGGPAGSCMALILAQRGFIVDVFELRGDPRKAESGGGAAVGGG